MHLCPKVFFSSSPIWAATWSHVSLCLQIPSCQIQPAAWWTPTRRWPLTRRSEDDRLNLDTLPLPFLYPHILPKPDIMNSHFPGWHVTQFLLQPRTLLIRFLQGVRFRGEPPGNHLLRCVICAEHPSSKQLPGQQASSAEIHSPNDPQGSANAALEGWVGIHPEQGLT